MTKKILLFISLCLIVILSFGAKQSLSFLTTFEDAMNPVIRIQGTEETEINCDIPQNNNGEYTFEVDYTDTRSTETYQMSTIPYAPILDLDDTTNLGTEVTFSGTDEFASTITFFPFSFFDETTNQLAIGENGIISLDPQQGGQINLRYPSANIPNASLTRNSIFAAHYDLMIHDVPSASVYYRIIGTQPARKLVITYKDAGVFYCEDGRTTSVQVVLEELTNEIQIYIDQKSSACGAITNAVVGIQDKYGNLGYSPNGRNYTDGDWTAQNEAYEFKPSGDRTPTISWIEGDYTPFSDDNNIIGTSEQITVNADLSNLQYTVEIRYPNYRNELGEIISLLLTDDIQVSPLYPIALDNEVVVCTETVDLTDYNEYVSLNPHQNFTITYYSDAALTNPIPNPTDFPVLGETTTVYAQIEYSADCSDVATLQISSIIGLLQLDINDLELYICDDVNSNNAENVETDYTLSDLDTFLLSEINNGTISYYSSANATTEITQADITEGMQIWLDVLVSGDDQCRTPRIGPITIHFYPTPEFLSLPSEIELVVCDKNWNFKERLDDNQTWVDIFTSNGLLTNSPDNIIKVYETEEDAINDENALTEITMDTSDPTYNPLDNSRLATLFIRIEDENGCYSINQVQTRIRFYGIDAKNTSTFNVCVDQNAQIPVDLSCFLVEGSDGVAGMFNQIFFEDGTTSQDINDVYDITYHANIGDANAGTNPISPNQTLTPNEVPTKVYYVRFTLCPDCATDEGPCYTVKYIRFRVVSTQPETDVIDVCRQNEGNTIVENLSIFNYQLFASPRIYDISYYANENDALNQTNELTSYEFTGDDYLWVHIQSNYRFLDTDCFQNSSNICEGVYRIRFVYGALIEPIDFPDQQINGVCDNNADGIEAFDITIFEDAIYDGEATFQYYTDMNEETLTLSGVISNPTEVVFTSTNGTTTEDFFISVRYDETACLDIVRLNITINFLSAIETEPTFLCACLPTPGEYATFDLTTALDDVFLPENDGNNNPLSSMIVTYHNFYNDAVEGVNQIFSPETYNSLRGEEDVFVRFYSTASSCYSVDTIQLKNLVLPVPIPNEIEICDTNINGDYDMFLDDLNELVMPNNTDNFYYSYFYSYEDALNNENPIKEITDMEDPLAYFYEFEDLPDEIFVRVDADNGDCATSSNHTDALCSGINTVTITTGTLLNSNGMVFDLPPVCDTFDETGEIDNITYNDGIASHINLQSMEEEIAQQVGYQPSDLRFLYYDSLDALQMDEFPYGEAAIEDPLNYTNMDNSGYPVERIYVKLENLTGLYCPIYVVLNLTVLEGPKIFPEEEYYVCPEGTVDISLNLPPNESPDNYQFEWTLPDGTIITDRYELLAADQIGVYGIRVTDMQTSCSSPKMNFLVLEIDPPVITELIVHNESDIEVIANGYGELPLEYSLDGANYQDSNFFYNLSPGVYDVWVRYNYNNKSCNGDIVSTILLKINNIVTPNGDGFNDCITITNLNVFGEANSNLIVYDRYGKVIHDEKDNNSLSWCGKYNGRVLPSSSYWYKLIIPDGREKTGHFTVKNY